MGTAATYRIRSESPACNIGRAMHVGEVAFRRLYTLVVVVRTGEYHPILRGAETSESGEDGQRPARSANEHCSPTDQSGPQGPGVFLFLFEVSVRNIAGGPVRKAQLT